MADSIREQIFQAVETSIEAITGIGHVSRGKIDPLDIQRYPAVFIIPGGDRLIEQIGTLVTRVITVFLFMWIKTQTATHQTLEAQLALVEQQMAADYNLGGKVIDVNETSVHEPFPLNDEETEAGVLLEYEITYRVNRQNPYSSSA